MIAKAMAKRKIWATMTNRSAVFLAIMDQMQDLAESAPNEHARLRLIDLMGVVYSTMSAEEVEAIYAEMTH